MWVALQNVELASLLMVDDDAANEVAMSRAEHH